MRIIHVLRQRVTIITPLDTLYTMGQNICAIGFIPSDHIAVRFSKLPQV
ncbi:MAG: hypothetical protein WAL97_00405 [Halobacteriota archaeon]